MVTTRTAERGESETTAEGRTHQSTGAGAGRAPRYWSSSGSAAETCSFVLAKNRKNQNPIMRVLISAPKQPYPRIVALLDTEEGQRCKLRCCAFAAPFCLRLPSRPPPRSPASCAPPASTTSAATSSRSLAARAPPAQTSFLRTRLTLRLAWRSRARAAPGSATRRTWRPQPARSPGRRVYLLLAAARVSKRWRRRPPPRWAAESRSQACCCRQIAASVGPRLLRASPPRRFSRRLYQ